MENFENLNLVELRKDELTNIEGGLAAVFFIIGALIGLAIAYDQTH